MLQRYWANWLEDLWYKEESLSWLLPFSKLYELVMRWRYWCYRLGLFPVYTPPIPVIVIGNLTVGGTGKTPLVVWLANYLKKKGYRPGILSRGYGGSCRTVKIVPLNSSADQFGEEPLLIAEQTNCPVVVGRNRAKAARELLEKTECNIILTDDGLQHLALGRHLEILLIDGMRRFGNGQCLPAGPLREPKTKADTVDFVVEHTEPDVVPYTMHFVYAKICSVLNQKSTRPIETFSGQLVHVVAGVGNPTRFFQYIEEKQLKPIYHRFPDHYFFRPKDIQFNDDLPVFMTEKDAIKCRLFSTEKHWFIPVRAELSIAFQNDLDKCLGRLV